MTDEGGGTISKIFSQTLRRLIPGIACLVLCVIWSHPAPALDGFPFSRENPQNVVGAEACAECHDYEFEAWGRTTHAESFDALHKRKRASEIARRMDFKRGVKRDTRCLTCHFTSEVAADGKREIAKAGVSCESCHGAGKPWKDIHNDKAVNRDTRLAKAISLGMRPPSDFYAVVSNCFQCHIVAFEDLVNEGKHSTGTSDFDMASRIDEIRHNFLESRTSGTTAVNMEATAEHRRVLQVAGIVLRAEYALRALAQATTGGIFYDESRERAEYALDELVSLASASGRSDIKAMARAVEGTTLELRQSKAQLKAADQLSREARKFFGAKPEGFDLAFVENLASGGAEEDDDAEADDSSTDSGSDTAGSSGGTPPNGAGSQSGSGSSGTSGSSGGGSGRTPAPSSPSRTINASGLASAIDANQLHNGQKTVKASSCKASCHESESKWWKGHEHSGTAKPFAAGKPKNVQIANALGISSAKLATGDNLCMSCHGTVVSGSEGKKIRDGVSCQSCHGSAGKFLKPHQDGDRAGYALGMNDLGKTSVRAQVCAGCHIIDYEPLLAAGHPTGKGWEYKDAIVDIEHWERKQPSVGDQAAAFAAIKAKRPIPAFTLAKLDPPSEPKPRASTPSPGSETRPEPGPKPDARPGPKPGPRPGPKPRPPSTPDTDRAEPADGYSLPEWSDDAAGGTVEQDMRVLQARLQQIYDALFGGTTR